ncbi:unnamed protein product [Urochloa decumbens]|uniref:Protein kinase domain-containing protein n=1 Tax=Urochloa decumbens TaxID=240449 RepID=A0ABC8Z4W1_9POAL
MAVFLHLRLPLPLLLAVLVAASHGVPTSGDSYDPSLCLKPQLCGNVSINYPFYLSDETGILMGNSSSYCGYPGLGIKCDGDNQAVMELGGNKYSISSINYKGGLTINVVDQEVRDEEACPRVDHNVTLPPWLTIPNGTVKYIVFFLDCYFGPRHGKRTNKLYIIASTSCLVLFCLVILAFFLACKCELLPSKSKDKPRIESFLQKNRNLYPKRYTYADLKRMTRSFSVKLGQGGFGAVYRGNLSNGCQIAVKMLKGTKGDGEEFMNEVASISRTSHVNIVTLLGYCLQGSKRALIYEYMPNGSLEKYAFNSNMNNENMLSWEKLFDIAIGIARGLEYLHRGCSTRIVHFDIKPHNVLLDQDFYPKISDFGLAKLCMNKESAISITGARGTIGYIAPEVYSKLFGTASSKSDVYSYGMMVLEMVGARDKNINADTESSSQYFPRWIYEHVDEYCISASEISGETTELVRKMIVVGLWCIQVIPTDRPTMTRVVEMLEGSTSNLELPPKVLLSL